MTTEVPSIPGIREDYFAYTPPFDVAAVIQDLLGYVPAGYLHGLKYVVLLNASGLSRSDRRRTIPSRGKKHLIAQCLGLYCRQRPATPAHIEIHVDRILQQAPRLALRVSVYRDSLFAGILYHELGHHIHWVLHPQHREPEAVANDWAKRLRKELFRQKYHSLTPEAWKRVRNVAAKLEQRRRRQPLPFRLGPGYRFVGSGEAGRGSASPRS